MKIDLKREDEPVAEGRYLVMVEDLAGWLAPLVLLRKGGDWYFPASKAKYPGVVHHSAFIPPMKTPPVTPSERQEFDL